MTDILDPRRIMGVWVCGLWSELCELRASYTPTVLDNCHKGRDRLYPGFQTSGHEASHTKLIWFSFPICWLCLVLFLILIPSLHLKSLDQSFLFY